MDRALERYARIAAGALRPPLDPSDPHALWLQSVAAGPSGILEAYAAHDGSRSAGGVLSRLPNSPVSRFTRLATWLSASAARDEHSRIITALGHSGARGLFPIGRVGAYRPLSRYESEDHNCVAIDVATGEIVAVIYYEDLYNTTPASEERLGVSWSSYLADLLAALEAGALDAARDDYKVITLVERQKPLKPLGPPPKPREDAEVFLELLRDRALIELSADPSPALIKSVGKALRARSEAKRLSSLRAAFDEADEVADDFADDDQLSALMALVRGAPG